MITSNKNYPFDGRVTTVETPSFCCMISTAKEGVFELQSVMFSDFSDGMENRRHVAKLLYSDDLDSEARLDFHDQIAARLDAGGMSGQTLRESLHELFAAVESEGTGFGALLDELSDDAPFKQQIDVEDYCTTNLETLFSEERESVYERLRERCADPALTSADTSLYFDHIRAVVIQLLQFAITKNCNNDVSMVGRMFVMTYLNQRGLSHLDTLSDIYNRAQSGHPQDGIGGIVEVFSENVTNSEMMQETMEHFHAEFVMMLSVFFDDFKSTELTARLE